MMYGKDKKPITCWAVAHWKDGIYSRTIRRTRHEAKVAFETIFGGEATGGAFAPNKLVKVLVSIAPASTTGGGA